MKQNRKTARLPHDGLVAAAGDDGREQEDARREDEADGEDEPGPGDVDVGLGREDVAQCSRRGGGSGIGVEVAEGVSHTVGEVGHEMV